MTNESTKTHAHKLLDALAADKKKSSKESFIRKEPSGGFDKLSSQGIDKSECMDDDDTEKKEGIEDLDEGFITGSSPYAKAYREAVQFVPEGSRGRLQTMFKQMNNGEDENEMIKKYGFNRNEAVMKVLDANNIGD